MRLKIAGDLNCNCSMIQLAGRAQDDLNAAPLLVPGDDGHEVQLQQPAQRIISLAPHLTELIYAAGAGNQLIAVSAYSDFPDIAKRLPQVGDASNLDLERIVALKPDLILAWKSNVSPLAVERLRGLSIPVYVTETRRLAGISARPQVSRECRRRDPGRAVPADPSV